MSWPVFFISVHPKLIEFYRTFGVFKSAEKMNAAKITSLDLRDFACDTHGSIDASPYGGGDGMIMRPDCLANACRSIKDQLDVKPKIIYTSPSGKPWKHDIAKSFADKKEPLIFICGRFGGADQRFIDKYVDEEYSIGDVVLAGGELPALMMVESALRFVPGVLGNSDSASRDSFGTDLDGLLEFPQYTRPQTWEAEEVPSVLLSGDHVKIEHWRKLQIIERTQKLRPDLLIDSKKGKK